MADKTMVEISRVALPMRFAQTVALLSFKQ
jgi:hypothetical protein